MSKKLSELTVEEFEGILSKFTDKLIWGLKSQGITTTTTTPMQHIPMPWDDQYKVWCNYEGEG